MKTGTTIVIIAILILIIVGVLIFINTSGNQEVATEKENNKTSEDSTSDYINLQSSSDDLSTIDETLNYLD